MLRRGCGVEEDLKLIVDATPRGRAVGWGAWWTNSTAAPSGYYFLKGNIDDGYDFNSTSR